MYAIDADRPEIRAPLWRTRRLGTPIAWTDIVQDTLIQPLIGIISSLFIGASTQTLYVVAKSKRVDLNARTGDLHDVDTVTLQSLKMARLLPSTTRRHGVFANRACPVPT